jgi:Fe-S cluster assembly protein SufD
MTTPVRASALYESTLAALGARAGETLEPAWLTARRAAAGTALRAEGFPHNRQEAWRFSALRPLLQLPFAAALDPLDAAASLQVAASLQEAILPPGACTVVLVNGRAQEPLARSVGGASVTTLTRAPGDLLERHLGRLSAGSGGFAAQNDALFEDAVVIRVPAGVAVEAPIHVVHAARSKSGPTLSCPRLLVVAEPDSRVTIVELFVSEPGAPHLQSALTEIVLARGADVTHTRIQQGRAEGFTVASVEVEQAHGSRYSSSVFTFGGTLSRVDLGIQLLGEGAECMLDGLYSAASGEQVEHRSRVAHRAPRATSHQLYKGVVAEGGTAVFDGNVAVARGASGSVAHQKNRNLVLSDGGVVHTKPHLEIDTDEVTCSHGATVGQLDETQVFYLRSRGIDHEAARAMLVDAFSREMIDRLTDASLSERLSALVQHMAPFGLLPEALQ